MKVMNVIQQSAAALIIAVISFAGCKKNNAGDDNAAEPVSVSGVSLNKTAPTLIGGASEALKATVAPDSAENKAVTWKSDEPDIVAVDADGNVTAVKPGTATVTVTKKVGIEVHRRPPCNSRRGWQNRRLVPDRRCVQRLLCLHRVVV